jgi:hypothetical protein
LIVIRVSKIRKFENPNLCVARSKPFAADLRRKAQMGKLDRVIARDRMIR